MRRKERMANLLPSLNAENQPDLIAATETIADNRTIA